MSIKRNFTIGIMDETKIDQINAIISNYADMSMKSSAHMYFDKQPINVNEVVQDVTFFRLKFDDETLFSSKLDDLIKSLDELDTDYILMDDESGKLIVTVDHGGYITVKFDNVRYLKPETYNLIDEIKCMKTDIGYCKGFKPKFRPLCGKSVEEIRINPEIIYLISDSDEHLEELRDLISERILEFEPDFELEFGLIAPQDF